MTPPRPEPPDPGGAATLEDLVVTLRALKIWAGDPSYQVIGDRINRVWRAERRPEDELARKSTVADCFKTGRRRLNTDLVIAVVRALHPDVGYIAQWQQAIRVVSGETRAAAQVRVQDTLPIEAAGFVGRAMELAQVRRAMIRAGAAGVPVVLSGMAGVGKTRLAIRAGHLMAREMSLDRVLAVDLRGFHPDPAQPPADPSAVLDGFLRLLGVPVHRIPFDLAGRIEAYRGALAAGRVLVLLDNAADERQVRPLLPPATAGAALVTSRRKLTGLRGATHIVLDVFTPDEAATALRAAADDVQVGDDPLAVARIARRCGYLPLAVGLIAGHIRARPGWTLTDHADRLDERHQSRRLDADVELALDLSYRNLPAAQQRLLRLLALHPGPDFDAAAAVALADGDIAGTETALRELHRVHLLLSAAPGRYTFHDLVNAYLSSRAEDEEPPPRRRAALTNLYDYYLATAGAAMDVLHPAEAHNRPRTRSPLRSTPEFAGPDAARSWLDGERAILVAVAVHAATHGSPDHATRLSIVLYRYLDGGYPSDAMIVHRHAERAARLAGDPVGQAHALTNLGTAHLWLGRFRTAGSCFQQARRLFNQAGDLAGQARALGNLGNIAVRLGRFRAAAGHHTQALALLRRIGDLAGEARALGSLGVIEQRLGREQVALDYLEQALTLSRRRGDHIGEAEALNSLGLVEQWQGRHEPAAEHLRLAIERYRQLGNRIGEGAALDNLGAAYTQLGRLDTAKRYHHEALAIFRETGDRYSEAWALNGLGEAAHLAGEYGDAATRHDAALAIAAEIGDRYQEARAHAGLGVAHHARGEPDRAREHLQKALTLFTDLGAADAERVRGLLAGVAVPSGQH